MAVNIKSSSAPAEKLSEDQQKPSTGPKTRFVGRPPGAVDKKVRKPRYTKKQHPDEQRMIKAIQATAPLTSDELLARGRELKGKLQVDGSPRSTKPRTEAALTEEHAERSAVCYRLMIRGLNAQQIAEQMGIEESTAKQHITRVEKMLRLDPKKLDVGYYMGESLAFYQEVRQMALLQSSAAKSTVNEKLSALRVAMQAEQDKNEFLERIGVYSPAVVSRVESWIVALAGEQIMGAPEARPRVNMAAEMGRLLASRFKVALGGQASE